MTKDTLIDIWAGLFLLTIGILGAWTLTEWGRLTIMGVKAICHDAFNL